MVAGVPDQHADANWHAIQQEYVCGQFDPHSLTFNWPSVEQLAEKHGVKASTVRARRTRERWVSKRQEFASETLRRYYDKAADERSSQLAELETNVLTILNTQLLLVQAWQRGHMNEDGQLERPAARELQEASRAIELVHMSMRRALGYPERTTAQVTKPRDDSRTIDMIMAPPDPDDPHELWRFDVEAGEPEAVPMDDTPALPAPDEESE